MNVADRRDLALTGRPRRRDYLLLAGFFLAIAVYGSLVPLRYEPRNFGEALAQFRKILTGSFWPKSRTDWVANVLLFVPIGFCGLAVFAVDRRRGWWWSILPIPLVLLLSIASSMAIEFSQLWFPPRSPAASDVGAQAIGTVAGMLLWFAVGRTLTEWLRSFGLAERRGDRVVWLLQAYVLGLLIYSAMPLDITIHPAELAKKFHRGRINLMPFADVRWNLESLWGLSCDVVLFIPLGMLTAVWPLSGDRTVRSLGPSAFLAGLLVACIELAQVPIASRFASTTDVFFGTVGAAGGAWIVTRWRGPAILEPSSQADRAFLRKSAGWLALGGVYALILVAVFCAPFEFIDEPDLVRRRFDRFGKIPFASLERGKPFNAISQVLRKTVFYVPLGAMLAMAVVPLRVPRAIRRLLLFAALSTTSLLAAAIELLQVWLPAHVPDITDLILCPTGAAVGMLIVLRIAAARDPAPGDR